MSKRQYRVRECADLAGVTVKALQHYDRLGLTRSGAVVAWRDRHNWPDVIRRRFADYQMDDVAAFLGRASIARHVA